MRSVAKKLKKNAKEFHNEFRKQLATMLVASFSFVSALLWRDAINSLLAGYIDSIKNFVPARNIYMIKFVVALAVTIVSVLVILIISKTLKPKD